jgi:hypothetical protein
MSDLEKTNLEAHVGLCSERYKRLEEKFENLDLNMNSLRKDHENLTLRMSSNHNEVMQMIRDSNSGKFKVLVTTTGTIIAALLSVLGYLVLNIK